MSKTLSLFLDVLRFAAAMVVVFGHFTQPAFSHVWLDCTKMAVAAVSAFFVLSGFVISYVVTEKEHSAFDYAVARMSRIYSVLVPAVVLSSLVLLVALLWMPEYVLAWWMPMAHPEPHSARFVMTIAMRSLLPLTFLNALHNGLNAMYPPLDSPIWSLGFEAGYYALFGIAVFARGVVRVLLLGVTAALLGPAVLQLFPIWLSGVLLQRWLKRLTRRDGSTSAFGVLCLGGVGLMCAQWRSFEAWSNRPHGLVLRSLLHGTGRAKTSDVFYFFAVATILLIVGVALLDGPAGWLLQPRAAMIRWCANHTFSLYLFHFPVFVILYMVTRYDRGSLGSVLLILAADVLLCALLSKISEGRKLWWRAVVAQALSWVQERARRLRASALRPERVMQTGV